jgi:hypothetical protein
VCGYTTRGRRCLYGYTVRKRVPAGPSAAPHRSWTRRWCPIAGPPRVPRAAAPAPPARVAHAVHPVLGLS